MGAGENHGNWARWLWTGPGHFGASTRAPAALLCRVLTDLGVTIEAQFIAYKCQSDRGPRRHLPPERLRSTSHRAPTGRRASSTVTGPSVVNDTPWTKR